MPPRKSNASTGTADGGEREPGISIEDLNLPRTMVQRLAKGVLPANTQIQKDALLAISKSATVFVSYLAAHANENAQRMNKKTIQPKDVMDALTDLEFASFIPRCEGELQKYYSVQCDKRNNYRRRVKEEAKAKEATAHGDGAPGPADAGTAGFENGAREPGQDTAQYRWIDEKGSLPPAHGAATERERDGEPSTKRARASDGAAMDIDQQDDMDDEENVGDNDDADQGSWASGSEGEEDTFEDAAESPEDERKEDLMEDPLEEREQHGENPDYDSEGYSEDEET